MVDLERVVVQREESGVAVAAELLRPADEEKAVSLESALRWVRRRVKAVHAALRILVGLLPDLTGVEPSVNAVRAHLGVVWVLPFLREMAFEYVGSLPPYLGFGPRPQCRWIRPQHLQHQTGTDPP